MRKILVLFAAAALVLALTPSAKAAGKYLGKPDFSFRGWYAMWGFSTDNNTDFDDDIHDHGESIYQRFRWWFDTNFDGKYGGTIGLEWNWYWGQDAASTEFSDGHGVVPSSLTYHPVWRAAGHGADLGNNPQSEANPANVRMKHAYIWFMVPGTPVKVTAGLQYFPVDPDLLMWGDQGDWFGVKVNVPIIKNMLNLELDWMKSDEGASLAQSSDESDHYMLKLTGGLAKWLTFGTYHVWAHVRENGYYAFDNFGAITPQGLGGRLYLQSGGGDYFWHGLWVSINPKPFYSRFHFNYFWADQDDKWFKDQDPSGWAFVGRAGITLGPFEIGLKGWYFTGNDDDAYDPNNPDWNRWIGPGDQWFGHFEVYYSGLRNWAFGNLNAASPGGTAALCLESDYQVTKKLLLDLLAGYIWSTDEADKPFYAADNPSTRALGFKNNDNGLGYEIDLRATYRIYSNLKLDLVGAYFIADNGLDHYSAVSYDPETDTYKWKKKGADDAYDLFWRLVYSF